MPTRRNILRACTAVLMLLLALSSCSSHKYTPEQWQFAMNALKGDEGRIARQDYALDSSAATVDFFLREGRYCTAILSVRSDTLGVVNCYTGKLVPPELFFAVAAAEARISGNELQRYDSLLSIDSCWLFFDSIPYWGKDGLKAFWISKAFNPKRTWNFRSSVRIPELENE